MSTPTGFATPALRRPDLLAGLAAVGLGLVLALGLGAESRGSLAAPGGLVTAGGRLAGLAAAYLLLLVVLLSARLPGLERAVGQDRLIGWHRRLGPWPLYLIAVHAVAVTLGYAEQSRTGYWHQVAVLLTGYRDVLAATVAAGLLVLAGVTSYRKVRAGMRYETWWAVHLYTYLALALSLAHQLVTGASFVGHPVTRAVWVGLWAGTAGVVLVCRVGLPVWRSAYHRLRVVTVRPEAPGVVSVVLRGRHLDRLPLAGGQFLQWRFLVRGLWWQAHPYSPSALPRNDHLRVTVKGLGDHSGGLAGVRPGTRVAIEGPYGVFTAAARVGDRVLLVGAGVGVTPLLALLDDLPGGVDVSVVVRASRPQDLVHHDEVLALTAARGGRVHTLTGPRSQVRIEEALSRLVPDLAGRDVYVCGPPELSDRVLLAARRAGTPEERLHLETFAL